VDNERTVRDFQLRNELFWDASTDLGITV